MTEANLSQKAWMGDPHFHIGCFLPSYVIVHRWKVKRNIIEYHHPFYT